MRVYLLAAERRMPCAVPHPGAQHVIVQGPCPHCGAVCFEVHGRDPRPSDDDRAWEADAHALCCDHRAGVLRAEVSTFFGVREDDDVLRGRCRVY